MRGINTLLGDTSVRLWGYRFVWIPLKVNIFLVNNN